MHIQSQYYKLNDRGDEIVSKPPEKDRFVERRDRDITSGSDHRGGASLTAPSLLREFFSLNATPKAWQGGAEAPPSGGDAARIGRLRRAKHERSSGGGPRPPSPASQQDAVSGGGSTPTLTAGCCEAGAGGEQHA